MNQKKAKRTRRFFRIAHGSLDSNDRVILAASDAFRLRSYVTHKQGSKLVPAGAMRPNGERELVVLHWRTIRLDPRCARAKYRGMKAAA